MSLRKFFPIGSFSDVLTLESYVYANIDSLLKIRDITLPKKIHLVKTMVFLVIIYGCELDYKES